VARSWRHTSWPGGPSRGRAHGVDERGPLQLGFLALSGEYLLELVDDQDQPRGIAGHPRFLRAAVLLEVGGGPYDLADQQVSVARPLGEALADHRGRAAAQLR
jgi:hypothetical protein